MLEQPRWKRNIAVVRGAVGWRDSAGRVVVAINWERLIRRRQPKINISAPGYGSEMQGEDDAAAND